MDRAVYKRKIEIIHKELLNPLPGSEIQYLMAPDLHRPLDSNIKSKEAGVLILLFPLQSDIGITFIKREVYDGVHSGQVSFPGGAYEEGDKSLENTALRETFEETGIEVNSVNIIGKLSPLFIPVSNYIVHPFVGYTMSEPDFRPDPTEVEYLIFSSIGVFSDPQNIKKEKWNLSGKEVMVPFFSISGETIWGATAMILFEFTEIVVRSGLNRHDH